MYGSVGAMGSEKDRATYDDLCAVPDHLVAELVDGELVVSPRPSARHALVTSRLGAQLGHAFDGPSGGADGPGGWVVLDEPELHLGPDVLVPDLAAWRRTRLPSIPDAPFLTLTPDWVCEVLSPRNTVLDRVQKLPIYAREGVGHAWSIDAVAHTLEVFRLHDGRWLLEAVHHGDGAVAATPFDALAVSMARWWADLGAVIGASA